MRIPWNDSATLVRLTKALAGEEAEPTILKEGKLIDVARHAAERPKAEWKSLKISLYERHVAPFGFRGATLVELLECVPRRTNLIDPRRLNETEAGPA